MNCGVTVAVLLAVTVSFITCDILPHRTEHYQCAGYCKGSSKFKYVPGYTYVYEYTADTSTSIRGATQEKSQLHLTATAKFHVASQCDFVLQLENVELADSDLSNSDSRSTISRSTQFAAALEKNSLHFSFQDGTIDELCPSDDPVWVLNVKRGVLSAFQNTMHDLSSAREKHHETDVTGTCETKYDVRLQEDETNKPILVIGKMKNFLACSHRMDHFLSLQSTSYMSSSAQSLPLIKSQQRGSQVIGDSILQKATNNEIHTFRPFSKHESGAVTMVNQVLKYKISYNSDQTISGGAPKRRTTLLYESEDLTIDKMNEEETVKELLETLVKKSMNGVDRDVPTMFSQLISLLNSMSFSELTKIFSFAVDMHMRKFLLDAMPFVSTTDSVLMMIDLSQTGEVTSAQMDSWLTSLAFQKRPTLTMISSVSPLLDGIPSAKALLGISSMVHSYCQQNKNCLEMNEVKEVMTKMEVLLGYDCESADQSKQQLILLVLKAIGNAGVLAGSSETLRRCMKAENPIEVRLGAISAYRRLPCSESTRSHLLDLYTNKQEDTELRIAAYLETMHCPTYNTIRRIKDTLYSEDINQVASFVWTHLTNLQETSSHWKQSIKDLVSNDFLQNKFKTDVRKFSRNYEGSFFSESLNIGAAAESNIIFTPQSYLPRSVALNLTLDLFGKSVNFLEIGGRAEGFERVVESLFGPEGYFPDGGMNKMLRKFRDKGDDLNSVENSIHQLADQFDAKRKLEKEPYASVYTRVFGNELQYSQLHGLKDIMGIASHQSPFDIFKKLIQENEIDYTKSLVLIDGTYTVPTCVGFPMTLVLNGSATVSFKMQGHANMKNIFTLNSIDIEGNVAPSAAVEFTGSMSVDATVTKAGVKLVNTLHTNMYVDGKMKLQGGDLVELKLNVPRKKVEIVDLSSQLFILHRDQLIESKGIEDRVENYEACSSDFTSSILGMKSCVELKYVNTSLHPTAPYFPLTGPFRFHLDVTKVDTFSAYELIFKHQKKLPEGQVGSSLTFHFDTPGSEVDRRLSAHYLLDWTNSVAKAGVVTPFIKLTASSKMENSDVAKTLDAVIALNNQELLLLKAGIRKTRNGHTGRYEPFFSLSYKKKMLMDITGKVNYVENFKYSADLVIKGLSVEPITVSGDLNSNDDKFFLMANIKSKFLTSTLQGTMRLSEKYLSTKATVEYKIGESQTHMLDFAAKLHENSKGTLVRESVYVTLQMSQFAQYSTEVSWDLQHSSNYIENTAKLSVGNTLWQTQQLYRYQLKEDSIDFAVLCTLSCPKLDVDYGVDIQHKVTNTTISSHFKATVTPQYKILTHLDYLKKMHQHNIDVDVKSPWYSVGMHGSLVETAPSHHSVELSVWWGAHTLNMSGLYLDTSSKQKVEHLLDVTLTGELNGKLNTGVSSSSSANNQWIQLQVHNNTYLVNVTYIKDIFHFFEGTVQLSDLTYSGSLVLLSTAVEKGFAVDLRLRKRLTMATKITCDGEKHGLQFELFWDKDANPSKKISLMAQAAGNKKEVLLEIPGRYLKGEVLTIASGVTGLLEWAEQRKISAQLEWNLDEDRADITAKLSTPFPRMESLFLYATYTLLQNEGIFMVDSSWHKEKLTVSMTVKRNNTVPGFWDLKVNSHVESTIPALSHLSFQFHHNSQADQQLIVHTLALLKYNNQHSTLEVNWKSDKSNIFGDIMLNSSFYCLEFMKHTLKYTDSLAETNGSLEISWAQENKITAEFLIKKPSVGIFRIVTPFSGYELTSVGYNFTKFQGANSTTYVKMRASALIKDYLAMFEILGSKSKSSLTGAMQFKTPFTDDFEIDIAHKVEKGTFNESLLIRLADEKLFHTHLEGEIHSFSNIRLSTGIQMLHQDMVLRVGNRLLPESLLFNCEGKWNKNNINITASGKYENSNGNMTVHFETIMNGSVLPQHLKLSLVHSSSRGTLHTRLHLPGSIELANILKVSDDLNWENRLDFKMPGKKGSIANKQSVTDGLILEHKMTANVNSEQASGIFTLTKDSHTLLISEIKAVITTPWTDPVTVIYEHPHSSIGSSRKFKPNLILQFKQTKEIRIEAEFQYGVLRSMLNFQIISPFHKPITVEASYNIDILKLVQWEGQVLIQWEGKSINMESKAQFEHIMNISGDFFIKHSDLTVDIVSGSFGFNVFDPEMTIRALGTYRGQKMGFDLSLLSKGKVYKGSLIMQTPLQNWENLSLSGQVNMVKPTKLAVVTLSRNLEDITLSGLYSTDIYSSKFSVAVTNHISGFYTFSIYGHYDVPKPNSHSAQLNFNNNGKKIEFFVNLQFDDESVLNSVMAETNLKTPFEEYETLSTYFSYNMKQPEKRLDFHLMKSSWKVSVESKYLFDSEDGSIQLKTELPFEELKEMSISLRYGINPVTTERTVNISMSRNRLVVDMAGTLLVSDKGYLTAGLEIKSPVDGYRKVKCNVAVSSSQGLWKSLSLNFSKEEEDYMLTGIFTQDTEARFTITTPLIGYENIEAIVGYSFSEKNFSDYQIKGRVYALLDMPDTKNEINVNIGFNKMNSSVSSVVKLPVLDTPHIEVKGNYDVRTFPASFSFVVNKEATEFLGVHITLERDRFTGEIFTPIENYKVFVFSGSFNVTGNMKKINLLVTFGKNSLLLSSSIIISVLMSEIQAELTTSQTGMEKIIFHGAYNFLDNEKNASVSLSFDTNTVYEINFSGTANSKSGEAELQINIPSLELNSMLLAGKYNLTDDYFIHFLLEKNGNKNNFGGYVAFTDDGTTVRLETPFEYAKDISLYGTYNTENDKNSANLSIFKNGHTTILNTTFIFESGNGIARIKINTPFEVMRELSIITDFSGILSNRQDKQKFVLLLSVLKNAKTFLNASAQISFNIVTKEIDGQLHLDTILTKEIQQLNIGLSLTPSFPPHHFHLFIVKDKMPVLGLRSVFDYKLSGFIYNLNFNTTIGKYGNRHLFVAFFPKELSGGFNVSMMKSGIIEQYVGDFKIDKNTGALTALLTTPIVGYEKFTFQWKCSYNNIYTEIITPFEDYMNHTLSLQFVLKPGNKFARFFLCQNDHILELRTALEYSKDGHKINLYIATPFTAIQRIDIESKYIQLDSNRGTELSFTINDIHFKLNGECLYKNSLFQANLHISSTLPILEKMGVNIFYNSIQTDVLAFGGSLDVADTFANFSGLINFDFLHGKLLGSVKHLDSNRDYNITWDLKNVVGMKAANVSLNLGCNFNFTLDMLIKMEDLKNVKTLLSFTTPSTPHSISFQAEWIATNRMIFSGGFSILFDNLKVLGLEGNVNLNNVTEGNIIYIEYLGLPFLQESKFHVAYKILSNTNIELSSLIKINGLELGSMLSYMPYKVSSEVKYVLGYKHIHFSLSCDMTTEHKVIDIKYQFRHHAYGLNSNMTLYNTFLPLVSITLTTPIKHYSLFHISNQYSINATHKGFKILLHREKTNGEISLYIWRHTNDYRIKSNITLPSERSMSWHGSAHFDVESGIKGNVSGTWNSGKTVAVEFSYVPDSFKANIRTPFQHYKNANVEFFLSRTALKKCHFIVAWGDKKVIFNATGVSNKIESLVVTTFFSSPWTEDFTLSGFYKSDATPSLRILLLRGNTVTKVEGQLKYFSKNSKFDINFISNINDHPISLNAGYDLTDPTKEVHFEVQFIALSIKGNGFISRKGVKGRLHVNSQFNYVKDVIAEGEFILNQSSSFLLRWDDKLYNFFSEHVLTSEEFAGQFTLICPYLKLQDTKFQIKYESDSASLKMSDPSEALYLHYSHQFKRDSFSVEAKMAIPSVTMLNNLDFALSLDIEKCTLLAIVQWRDDKVINVSATLLPGNQFVKIGTPFQHFEEIVATGAFRNEPEQLVFIGNIEMANEENNVHVQLSVGKVLFDKLQHTLLIRAPYIRSLTSTVNVQFDDPSNMSAKLEIIHDFIYDIGGILNLKDKFARLSISMPYVTDFVMEGELTLKSFKDVKGIIRLVHDGDKYEIQGSYILSEKGIDIKLIRAMDSKYIKQNWQTSILLGGSYDYKKHTMQAMLYMNDNKISVSYKINDALLIGDLKLNSYDLSIKNCSFHIQGSYSPHMYGFFGYNYNDNSGEGAFSLQKIKDTGTLLLQCNMIMPPLFGPVNHTVQFMYNNSESQISTELSYLGKNIHIIKIMYETDDDDSIFKLTTTVSSEVLGNHTVLMLYKKNWETAYFKIINVFCISVESEQSKVSVILQYAGQEHEMAYNSVRKEGSFQGSLNVISPLISSGKANLDITATTSNEDVFLDLKCLSGTTTHRATLQISNDTGKKTLTMDVVSALKTILNLNVSAISNKNKILVEASLDFLGTVSNANLRHTNNFPLDTELNVMSSYIPAKKIRATLNTENNSLIFYIGQDDVLFGQYIMLEGTINCGEGTAYLNFKAPKLPIIQYIGVSGVFKFDGTGNHNMGFASKMLSESLPVVELSGELDLSRIGIDVGFKFMPPWQDSGAYGASVSIPFVLSKNMTSSITLNLGKNNTYSLHAMYVNLKDIWHVGFGGQYRVKKLGGALKFDNTSIPSLKFEADIPFGDKVGHYGAEIEVQAKHNLLGVENILNYTHISIEWDTHKIEFKYSLFYSGPDVKNISDIEKYLQCTVLMELSTPFHGYEQTGFKTYIELSPSHKLIVASINYPKNLKPFGFEFNYQMKDCSDLSLVTQIHIPFVPALEDVALVFSSKFDEDGGKFRSVLGGHWNKEELAVTLGGNLMEGMILKGSVSLHLLGHVYTLEGNYSSDAGGPFVIRLKFLSPIKTIKNAEVYLEIDLMKSLLASVTHNSEELLGFRVYSDEVTLFAVELRNPWRSAYFVFGYDVSKDIMIQAELSWDMKQSKQFGVIFSMSHGPHGRHDVLATLKLPTRTLMLNLTRQVSPIHIEYAVNCSWKKGEIFGFTTVTKINTTSDFVVLSTLTGITLPFRSFELVSRASVQLDVHNVKYASIGGEFLWDALKDRSKKIGIQLKRYSSVLEIALQHPALKNDLIVHVERNGKFSNKNLPFAMKLEIKYSDVTDDLITMELHVHHSRNSTMGLDAGFSLYHKPTSLDFKVGAEMIHRANENSGRLSAEYFNSYTGQKHRIEFVGIVSLTHPEVKIAFKTMENHIEVCGLLQSGNNGHYSIMLQFVMNQKEPLSLEANVDITEPKAELKARYGNSRSYKAYIRVPHCREITFGIKHKLYNTEYEDAYVLLRLNTSQLLWSRCKWKPQALAEIKTNFLQEYADVAHMIQSIGSGYSEAWLKDITYKCNIIHPVLVDAIQHVVSTSSNEMNDVYSDFLKMGEEMAAMYRRNDFYLQDVQPYVSRFITYIKEKTSGVLQLFLDGIECTYVAVKDFVVMIMNTLQIDLSRVFESLGDLKGLADRAVRNVAHFVQEVEHLHMAAKQYTREKIKAVRSELAHIEERMKQLLLYVENYLDDILKQYIKLLEPYVVYIENTLELLSRRVIDFEDEISEHIVGIVDTVLGAEEVQELLSLYNKYSSWLEEFHFQEHCDHVTKLLGSIVKLIMQDIQRVCADYVEYVHSITDSLSTIYKNFNAMPLIAYTKHAITVLQEKVKWLWENYEVSEHIKTQVRNWIENLDKLLLQLLNTIDMDASSPTKSLTPSVILRPDIGLVEYTQKLPIDWHGFNELPKFEQLQLYEQAKDHANEIASLDKYRYYLMDTLHDITNISITSMLPPFKTYGMVIGKQHLITFDKKHYNFIGECSYLLASDFLNNKFSVLITYEWQNRETVKKSLTLLVENHKIEISYNKRITVDGQMVELPVGVGSQTWIKRIGQRIVVHSDLGIELDCNVHYDICSVELSGWYFGKTSGLLGTFDYEPSNDLFFPNGTTAHTIEEFANSWHVGSAGCHSVNHAPETNVELQNTLQTTSDNNQCITYFEDQLSPLRSCFSRVEPSPFYQMCLSEVASQNTEGVCLSIAAYVSQCKKAYVDVWMPHECVQCKTLNGSTINGGQLKVYDGIDTNMADVVFVVEQSPCIKNINFVEILSKLCDTLNRQKLNTRFSVVSFNGKKFNEPHLRISEGQIWSTQNGAKKVLSSLQSAISESSSIGSRNVFSALWYAARLPFRETASKTVILMQCSSCQAAEDNYSDMLSMLLENDITLHILEPHAVKLHSGKEKTSKVYGIDLNGAFSGRNVKNLMPSFPLLRQVALPKDLCTPLAFETNGTLFNMDRLLHSETNTHRISVKKFLDVWTRRVALTATSPHCQKCECLADQDVVGQIICSKCLSPSIEQFLKQWEDLRIENQRSQKHLEDHTDYPA